MCEPWEQGATYGRMDLCIGTTCGNVGVTVRLESDFLNDCTFQNLYCSSVALFDKTSRVLTDRYWVDTFQNAVLKILQSDNGINNGTNAFGIRFCVECTLQNFPNYHVSRFNDYDEDTLQRLHLQQQTRYNYSATLEANSYYYSTSNRIYKQVHSSDFSYFLCKVTCIDRAVCLKLTSIESVNF